MIRVGFSTSSWWVSRLIRWATKSTVSHAFLLLDGPDGHPLFGDLVLEAEWCGWALSSLATLKRGTTHVVTLVEPAIPLGPAVHDAAGWLSEKYNYEGLLGEALVSLGRRLGKRWRNPLRNSRSMFCSEAICYVFIAANYPLAITLDPQSTSPQDLLDFLTPSAKSKATVRLS